MTAGRQAAAVATASSGVPKMAPLARNLSCTNPTGTSLTTSLDVVHRLRVLGVAHVDNAESVREQMPDVGEAAVHHDLYAVGAPALVGVADEPHGTSVVRVGRSGEDMATRAPFPRLDGRKCPSPRPRSDKEGLVYKGLCDPRPSPICREPFSHRAGEGLSGLSSA